MFCYVDPSIRAAYGLNGYIWLHCQVVSMVSSENQAGTESFDSLARTSQGAV